MIELRSAWYQNNGTISIHFVTIIAHLSEFKSTIFEVLLHAAVHD